MSAGSIGRKFSPGRDLPVFALFLLVGAAAALGVRALLLPGPAEATHDHVTAPPKPPEHSADGVPDGPFIDLGNEICPIMKKPVTGHTWSYWNGLRIGHCCPPCAKDLLEDPERLLDEMGIEWRPAAEAMRSYREAAPEDRPKVLEEISARFTVVGRN